MNLADSVFDHNNVYMFYRQEHIMDRMRAVLFPDGTTLGMVECSPSTVGGIYSQGGVDYIHTGIGRSTEGSVAGMKRYDKNGGYPFVVRQTGRGIKPIS